jgi:glycerol-3-phosphate dehydrogenase
MRMVAEGEHGKIDSCLGCRKLNVEMPITEKMFSVLHEDSNRRMQIADLMERRLEE